MLEADWEATEEWQDDLLVTTWFLRTKIMNQVHVMRLVLKPMQ